MAKDKRFERIYVQSMGSMEIWVDKETGVNYLYRQSGYAGGLTVLLDKDGKPVVTPVEE
ncbi:MAG: xylan 1,4-beta-xylosidase [Clostridia bacterium]|nr:xylan 1,4-beta-xylosidase [Clostridia bacterium]